MLQTLDTRHGLPDELRGLIDGYPRDGWTTHPHFARSIQNWLNAHSMFRQLGQILTKKTEQVLDRRIDDQTYVKDLGHFGNLLVRNLHGHHTWEDREYFPELAAADTRFTACQDLLEGDHVTLDQLLDQITRRSNRVIQLFDLDRAQLRDEIAPLSDQFAKLERFLHRHLSDEEDLVVPILLHHKMRS